MLLLTAAAGAASASPSPGDQQTIMETSGEKEQQVPEQKQQRKWLRESFLDLQKQREWLPKSTDDVDSMDREESLQKESLRRLWLRRASGTTLWNNFQCSNCLNVDPDCNNEGKIATGDVPCEQIPVRAMFVFGDLNACDNPKASNKLFDMGMTLDACNYEDFAIPECFDAKNWNAGWICQTMNDIFVSMGANVIVKTGANQTIPVSMSPSAMTRCAYEVKADAVDLCVGSIWETAERRNISAFTAMAAVDKMKLITMPAGGIDAVYAHRPFDVSMLWVWALPFTWKVWVCAGAMTILAAMMLWVVEYGYHRDLDGVYRLTSECRKPPEEPVDQHQSAVLSKLFYASLLGVLHRPPIRPGTFRDFPNDHIVSWGGRIVLYGYGIFVFLISSNYIAQWVKIWHSGGLPPQINFGAFDDIIEKNGKFCLLDPVYKEMAFKMPNKKNVLSLDAYGPVFEHLYKDKCQMAIVGQDDYSKFVLQSRVNFTVCDDSDDPYLLSTCLDPNMKATQITVIPRAPPSSECKNKVCNPKMVRRYCEMIDVNDENFLFDLPIAFPVANWLNPYLSAWITVRKYEGTFERARSQYGGGKDDSSNVCAAYKSSTANSMTMDVQYGLWIWSAGIMVLGAIVNCVIHTLHWIADKKKRSPDGGARATLGVVSNHLDMYEQSYKGRLGAREYLQYDGPDPSRVDMEKKVKSMERTNKKFLQKMDELHAAQIARDKEYHQRMEELIKREAEERERVLRQEFAKHKDVMAHTAWPMQFVRPGHELILRRVEDPIQEAKAAAPPGKKLLPHEEVVEYLAKTPQALEYITAT